MAKGLRKAGYQTQAAFDGREALSLTTSANFDLILLDLGLPRLDGETVLSETRSRGIQTPVIVVTAQTSSREQVLALGANDYVLKPFRFKDLLSCIRSYI